MSEKIRVPEIVITKDKIKEIIDGKIYSWPIDPEVADYKHLILCSEPQSSDNRDILRVVVHVEEANRYGVRLCC